MYSGQRINWVGDLKIKVIKKQKPQDKLRKNLKGPIKTKRQQETSK